MSYHVTVTHEKNGGYETEGILLDHRGQPLVVDSTATHGFPEPESRFGSTALTPTHTPPTLRAFHPLISMCLAQFP